MKALAIVQSCHHEASNAPDETTLVVDFCATEDPQSGQISIPALLTLNEAQLQATVRNAVATFINQQRGANVIGQADVRVM